MAKAKPVVGLNSHTSTGQNARIIARVRLDELYAWARYAGDPAASHELHDMRIAAKRLRYTLEIFEDVLPEGTANAIKEVTQIQEELGNLHDSDVMIELLQLARKRERIGYAEALAEVEPDANANRDVVAVNPEFIAYLLNPGVTPSERQRHGLEQLLAGVHRSREGYYAQFYQHWQHLQARDFRREVLNLLDMLERRTPTRL